MLAFKDHLNKMGLPKKSYKTLESAVDGANSETTRLGCFRMVPYVCSYCGMYHVGKPNYSK